MDTVDAMITNKSPDFLQNYDLLKEHFESEFESLSPQQRGDYFTEFALRLVPHTETGARFSHPRRTQDSWDEGVDIVCDGLEPGEVLYIQSKYTISSVDNLDLIMSKFDAYLTKHFRGQQMEMFDPELGSEGKKHFMIVTLSDLARNVSRYEKSERKTVPFYLRLKAQGRIDLIDGPRVLQLLRQAYRKSQELPSKFQLNMSSTFLQERNVYVGIVPGSELKRLYDLFGPALFFEDPREYLGPTSSKVKTGGKRITVNEAIIKTLEDEPEKFLARNNGVTFRASQVSVIDKSTLELSDASIVNGCQTTYSVLRVHQSDCHVLVKVVEAPDTWDIAMAANFQNEIYQIELELTKYLRPQAIRAVASRLGYQFKGDSSDASAYAVVDVIYRRQITQDEFKYLFIGIFSTAPRNIIGANYTEIRSTIIDQIFQPENPDRELVFDTLLKIHQSTVEGSHVIEENLKDDENLSDMFRRFWKDEKAQYRAYLAVLAICGCVNRDIYIEGRSFPYTQMIEFLAQVKKVLETSPDVFLRYYQLAFNAVAIDAIKVDQNRDEFLRYLHQTIEKAQFSNHFIRVRALASTDTHLKELMKSHRE